MIETMATTWESIEERERRVRGTRTTRAIVRAGQQVPAGSKSVAVALTFRSAERTLTDAEVDALMEGIRAAVKERYSATFRT